MFKVPFTIALAILFSGCLRFPASPVQTAESSLIKIVGHVDDDHLATCSGFVIDTKRVLTANHCLADITNLTYDGVPASKVILRDNYYDLALVAVDTNKPALQLSDDEVYEGQELTAIGYAHGWNRLLVLNQIVRMTNYPVEPDAPSGIIIQGGLIGGMSGGPIIDKAGRVVAVCQRGYEFMGYGVSAPIIKTFLRDAEGHGEATFGLGYIQKLGKDTKVDLKVTPRYALSAPMTVRTTIHTDPDENARVLCLQWDSEIGDAGTHCFTHEGVGAPKTTQWDLLIHSPGEYAIQASLIRVSDVVRSAIQRVIVQGL